MLKACFNYLESLFPEKKGLAGLCQINPVTKTGQRLYMVRKVLAAKLLFSS